MKIFIRLLIIVVFLMWIGCYFIIGTNRIPLFTRNAIQQSKFLSFNELINKPRLHFFIDTKSPNTNTFQVYKWKDQKGVIHYADQNDPRYKSKLTELKGITILPIHKEESKPKPDDPETKFLSKSPGLTTIPLQQIPKLIKDVKQVKKTMEERKDSLDRVLDAY